jgi:hypothetical protein
MKYWYDTEFYEDGSTIDLISIGIVAEDGREFYRESKDFDWLRVPHEHWLWDNVWPHLFSSHAQEYNPVIARDVHRFITKDETEFDNELWGYYSAYDHVVLAQLFGRMVDMPEGVPWFTQDIQQIKTMLHNEGWEYEFPSHTSTQHHALADARWTKKAYDDIWMFVETGGDW